MRHDITAAFVVGSLLCLHDVPASAAEGGIGVYLMRSRSNAAGITPPAGVYFQDDTYFYDAKIGGSRSLPVGGLLVANVNAQTWLNLPTTAGFFTVSMPLAIDTPVTAVAAGKSMKAKF